MVRSGRRDFGPVLLAEDDPSVSGMHRECDVSSWVSVEIPSLSPNEPLTYRGVDNCCPRRQRGDGLHPVSEGHC